MRVPVSFIVTKVVVVGAKVGFGGLVQDCSLGVDVGYIAIDW